MKPWPSSADFAFAYGWPVTSGTGTGFAPRETLMRTVVPLITRSPGGGLLRRDGVRLRVGVDARDLRLQARRCASAVTAAVTSWPTTFGHRAPSGLPVETVSVTVEPLPIFDAAAGILVGDLPRRHRARSARLMTCAASAPPARSSLREVAAGAAATSGTATGLFAVQLVLDLRVEELAADRRRR